MSIPGYCAQAAKPFNHPSPTRLQHSPHPWVAPNYIAKTQFAERLEASNLAKEQQQYVRKFVGVFLFYARAIDNTMLTALNLIGSNQCTNSFKKLNKRIYQFLDYAATHPDAKLTFITSKMHLWSHTDASYLSETRA